MCVLQWPRASRPEKETVSSALIFCCYGSVILCRAPYVLAEALNYKSWMPVLQLLKGKCLTCINVFMINRHVLRSDTSKWAPSFEYTSAAAAHITVTLWAPGWSVTYEVIMAASEKCHLYQSAWKADINSKISDFVCPK